MRTSAVCLLFFAFAPASLSAATPEEVARLRQEVDSLATALEDERRRSRDELTSLRAQRAELERQVRLERVRRATLAEIEREATAASVALDEDLAAQVEPGRAALAEARRYLDRALPFKLEERRRELDRVQAALDEGRPAQAMSRLWRFVQQEDAMGGEVSLSRQSVELADGKRLADVARIGMALLYVRAPDGVLAQAIRVDGEWQIAPLAADTSREAVSALFRALEDNRRLGRFDLLVPRESIDAR